MRSCSTAHTSRFGCLSLSHALHVIFGQHPDGDDVASRLRPYGTKI